MRMKLTGSFGLRLCCLLGLTLLSAQAFADSIVDDWATLPPKKADGKYDVKHFSTPWPAHIKLGENGFLMVGTGEFGAFSIFEISPTGECTFIFLGSTHDKGPVEWRKASFKVSGKVVQKLIADIEKSNVSTLEKDYLNSNYQDGGQAFFSVSDGNIVRTVWMDNSFPEDFRSIIQSVARLIDSQHSRLNLAPLSSREASRSLYRKAFPAGVN